MHILFGHIAKIERRKGKNRIWVGAKLGGPERVRNGRGHYRDEEKASGSGRYNEENATQAMTIICFDFDYSEKATRRANYALIF